MPTRKSRNKLKKTVDLLVPVDIYKLGTEDDPCFGKHYNPKETECRRCGDCELCAIVLGQANHKKRETLPKETTFMDMEEKEIYEMKPKTKVRKLIKTLVKENPNILVSNLSLQVRAGLEITEKEFKSILNGMVKKEKIKIKSDRVNLP